MARVTQALIEKYHRGECSRSEQELVEQWLLSGDADEQLDLPPGEDREQHQREIWRGISRTLPRNQWYRRLPVRIGKTAAVLLTGIFLVAIAYRIVVTGGSRNAAESFAFHNKSANDVQDLQLGAYDITLAPNSIGTINHGQQSIAFTGSILISPKADIELTLNGMQYTASDVQPKHKFKKGEIYIAFTGPDAGEPVIVVSRRDLTYLPDVLQKQLMNQFSI